MASDLQPAEFYDQAVAPGYRQPRPRTVRTPSTTQTTTTTGGGGGGGTPGQGATSLTPSIIARFREGIDPKDPNAVAILGERLKAAGYDVEVKGDRIRLPGSYEGWIDVLQNKTYLQGGPDNRAWTYQPFHSKEDMARIGMPVGGSSGGMGGAFGGGVNYGARQGALEQTPGYQFRFDQGRKMVEGGHAAKGTLLTGGAAKDLVEFGQGLASTEFDNEYRRLFGIAGLGMNAAGAQGQYGSGYANNATNLITGAGNATASGTIGGANAWNNGINNAVNTGMDAWMYYNMNRPPPTSGTPPYVPPATGTTPQGTSPW